MKNELLMKARTLLENQTPMAFDCGLTCDAACCSSDEDGQGGVYLFPGEEALIGSGWMTVNDEDLACLPVRMMTCEGECDRSKRPLGCMIFPLTPVVDDNGHVDVRFDVRAKPLCPIMRDGLRGLRFDFVEAVRKALNLIAQDEEGLVFLKKWQEQEEKFYFTL